MEKSNFKDKNKKNLLIKRSRLNYFIIVLGFILTIFCVNSVSATWCSTNGFTSKIAVNITETSGKDLTNYSIYMNNIPFLTGMNSDFSNIRFTDPTETLGIPYWIESYSSSNSAKVWIKIPTLNASSITTIYLCYGNPSTISNSSFNNAFLFADDFSSDTSANYDLAGGSCSYSISGGIFTLTSSASGAKCSAIPKSQYQILSQNYTIEANRSFYETGINGYSILSGYYNGTWSVTFPEAYNSILISTTDWAIRRGDTVLLQIITTPTVTGFYNQYFYENLTIRNVGNDIVINTTRTNVTITSLGNVIHSSVGNLNGTYGMFQYTSSNPSGISKYDWFRVTPFVSSKPTYTLSISPIIFTLCNTTYNIPFINYTFKDEETNTPTTAALTASFNYYTVNGMDNKIYTFQNTTENPSYAFCISPSDKTVYVTPSLQYSNSNSTIRTYNTINPLILTNTTTNNILYLLETINGIYSSYQVTNVIYTPISSVLVTAILNGNIIESKLTDSSGIATLFLNPNIPYIITASKLGFSPFSGTIIPTQSTYSIVLGGTTGTNQTAYTDGINISIAPSSQYLNLSSSYNFQVNLTSSLYTLDNWGFNITDGNLNVNLNYYQESVNVSTSCGGLNTGSYSYELFNYNNRLVINYTKPTYSLDTSLWATKWKNTTDTYQINYSIPSSCWNWNANMIKFAIYERGNGDYHSVLQCYNGSWVDIVDMGDGNSGGSGGSNDIIYDGNWSSGIGIVGSSDNNNFITANDANIPWFYEEAMVWNISYVSTTANLIGTITLPQSTTSFTLGSYTMNSESLSLTVFWTINGTTTTYTKSYTIEPLGGSDFSIYNGIVDLKKYLNNGGIFGLTGSGVNIVIFILILITTGIATYRFGLSSPSIIAGIVTIQVFLFDVVFGLIFYNPGFLPGKVPHIATVFMGIVLITLIIREGTSY